MGWRQDSSSISPLRTADQAFFTQIHLAAGNRQVSRRCRKAFDELGNTGTMKLRPQSLGTLTFKPSAWRGMHASEWRNRIADSTHQPAHARNRPRRFR